MICRASGLPASLLLATWCILAPPASGGGVGNSGETIATPPSWKGYEETKGYLNCAGETTPERTIVRGDFLGGGGESGLVLYHTNLGCAVGRETGGGRSGLVGWSYAGFAFRCRDSATGRDHAGIFVAGGKHHEIQMWAVEPGNAAPGIVYREPAGEEVRTDRLIAADGACLWRNLLSARETYRKATAALQVGEIPEVGSDGSSVLPMRTLDAAMVRKWLTALYGAKAAYFEGARYATAADRRSWAIVQITGPEPTEIGGMVLALDRKTGTWRSIYDVLPGSTKQSYYGMTDMAVDGDRLYAMLCTICSGWDSGVDSEIDLRTGGVVRLKRMPEERMPVWWRSRPKGSDTVEVWDPVRILDPVAEFFTE